MYDYLKNKNALYVEDEPDVLKNIHELLKGFFSTFYTARDGESGYQVFIDNKIDVMLVDIELPKLNGIDLIKKIRKTNKNIPIIVISAYTKKDYLLESIELNLTKYIVKPLTSPKIHQILKKLDKKFAVNNTVELLDGVFLYRESAMVRFDNKQHKLTKKELSILDILSRRKSISYNEIYNLWEDTPSQNAIRSCFKQLRKKLPANFIKNINGIGYYI